jgi:hydrogenase expression/formation protein HypC
MCVSVVGKIIEIDGNTAKVTINNNICQVNISLISPKIGDYVLVHAGCVLEILKKEMADEIVQLFSELEDTI